MITKSIINITTILFLAFMLNDAMFARNSKDDNDVITSTRKIENKDTSNVYKNNITHHKFHKFKGGLNTVKNEVSSNLRKDTPKMNGKVKKNVTPLNKTKPQSKQN